MTEEQINEAIGMNLRKARERAGYLLKDVAQQTGVTYQQIQKYEKGLNRIPACRVVTFAKVLLIEPSDLLPEVF